MSAIDLSPAAIGLLGALAGAIIGLTGSLVSTSRQIARQERDARRTIYGRYLASAVALDNLLDRQRTALASRTDLYGSITAFEESIASSRGRRERRYWAEGLAKQKVELAEADATARALLSQHAQAFDAFMQASHEQKIHAPKLLHDTAMLLYGCLHASARTDLQTPPEVGALWNEALQIYSQLARADVRSPGSGRPGATFSKHKSRVSELQFEIERVVAGVGDAADIIAHFASDDEVSAGMPSRLSP